METIQNIAAAASKAIYGEQTTAGNETAGEEPISGETGQGTVESPYDQGNATNPISTSNHPASNNISKTGDTTFSKTETTIPDRTASDTNKMPHDSPTDNNNNGSSSNNPFVSSTHGSDPDSLHQTHTANVLDPRIDADTEDRKDPIGGGMSDNSHVHTHGSDPSAPHANKAAPRIDSNQIGGRGTGDINSIPKNPNNAAEGGPPDPHQDTDKTGVVGGHGNPFVTTDKSTERSSNPGPVSNEPKIKQQGAANPNDNPMGEQKDAVKDTKEDAEDFLKTKDPNDHSGEPMHMHTGGPGEGGEVPRTQEERRDSNLGQPGGQEHGKEEQGTGEEWVKTTGIAADGGDFDVTKPGAGREANRLMEEKGIHRSEPGKPAPPPDISNTHKDKVPLGQKIKDKLHIGSHKG